MIYLSRAFPLAVLAVAGFIFDGRHSASAQAPQDPALTTDSLKTLAQQLKQDLQDGSIMLADVHAIRLRLALMGASTKDLSAKISVLEQQPPIDDNDPSFTTGIVPTADKLLQELDEPHRGSAQRYAEQLAIQIHKQNEIYTERQILTSKSGDRNDSYFAGSARPRRFLTKR